MIGGCFSRSSSSVFIRVLFLVEVAAKIRCGGRTARYQDLNFVCQELL